MTWQEAAPALNLSTTALFPCDLALHVYHVTLEFAYFKVSVRRLSHHEKEHANKSKKGIQKINKQITNRKTNERIKKSRNTNKRTHPPKKKLKQINTK